MKALRTPDECFENLKDYPFEPFYTNIQAKDGTSLRIHHIDVGPKDGPILLAMHGQPVWSYLYARMIPILNKSGIRVIAPDLVGYGKSDKPSSIFTTSLSIVRRVIFLFESRNSFISFITS